MKIQCPNSFTFAFALFALALNAVAAQPASSGSFSVVGSMSQFRRVHTATLLSNGKVLVAGGSPFAQAATSELYDPTTLTWTNSGALNLGREFHTATLLTDGSVMVAGGQTANRLLASTEVYDPASGVWTNTGAMNVERELHTATLAAVPACRHPAARWPSSGHGRAQRDRTSGERGAVRSEDPTLDTNGLHACSSRDTYRFTAARRQSAGHRRRWFRRALRVV